MDFFGRREAERKIGRLHQEYIDRMSATEERLKSTYRNLFRFRSRRILITLYNDYRGRVYTCISEVFAGLMEEEGTEWAKVNVPPVQARNGIVRSAIFRAVVLEGYAIEVTCYIHEDMDRLENLSARLISLNVREAPFPFILFTVRLDGQGIIGRDREFEKILGREKVRKMQEEFLEAFRRLQEKLGWN